MCVKNVLLAGTMSFSFFENLACQSELSFVLFNVAWACLEALGASYFIETDSSVTYSSLAPQSFIAYSAQKLAVWQRRDLKVAPFGRSMLRCRPCGLTLRVCLCGMLTLVPVCLGARQLN